MKRTSPRVVLDGRLAVRGLGIGSFVTSLEDALEANGVDLVRWRTRQEWGPSGVALTLLRSGLVDVCPKALSPLRDTRTVFHFASNLFPVWPTSRSVVTVHDFMFERDNGLMSRFQQRTVGPCLRQAGAIVAISDSTADLVLQRYPEAKDRLTVVPHGWTPPKDTPHQRSHLLIMAGNDPRKRSGLGIDAYRAYAARLETPLPLVVLGRALDPRSELAVQCARTASSVLYDATRSEVARLLSQSAALIYPSEEEGFGLPIVEAAQAATSVVIDAGARIPRSVRGSHCVEVDGASIQSWADGIDSAIARTPVSPSLPLPTWDDVASQYADLYRWVLRG